MPKNTNLINESKLVLLIRSLSKDELVQFGQYISSPYFNTRSKPIYLYEWLKAHYNTDSDLSKVDALYAINQNHEHSFPLSPKSNKQLRNEMSDLSNLLEQFLLQKKWEDDKTYNHRLLADSLMERKQYKYVSQVIADGKRTLQENPERGRAYAYTSYLLEEVAFYKNVIVANRSVKTDHDTTLWGLHCHVVSELLIHYCSAINRAQVVKASYHSPLLEAALAFVEEFEEESSSFMKAFYHLIMIQLNRQEEQHFAALETLMSEQSQEFNTFDLRQVYAFMLNYCFRRLSKGELIYRRKCFEIYQQTLPMGIWNAGIYFSAHQYIIITKVAGRLGEFEWLGLFIDEYENELDAKYLPDIPNLAKAYYHYYQKDLEKAQKYLSLVTEEEDFIYTFSCKALMIHILYERGGEYIDLLEAAIHTLRVAIGRNKKLGERIILAYQNFINLTKRLFRLREKLEKGKISQTMINRLKRDLSEIEPLNERDWLIEMIEELEKSI